MIAAIAIWIVPILYLVSIYPTLPDIVPTHFDLNGKADQYGKKSEIILGIVILSVFAIGVYFLLQYLPKIDPKKTAGYSAETFRKIALLMVVFFTILEIMLIHASLAKNFTFNRLLFPLLGLFFAYLGNLMHSIKPNYFVGIRTPWTLEDPETWRVTHQLGGKLFFAGGVLITLLTLILHANSAFVCFISITMIIGLTPVIYSYVYYRKTHKN